MAKPKVRKFDNIIYQPKEGNEQVDSLMAGSDPKSTFLPPSIGIADIDMEVIKLVSSGDLSVAMDGKEVPVIFMNNERWGEFSKTWKLVDEDMNVTPPFITMKKTNAEPGTYLLTKYSIPNKKPFHYLKVPTYENGSLGFDIYKIPQPTAIDLTYEITLFCRMQMDVNVMTERYFSRFSDRQLYINVLGHYFPVLLEGSESNDNIEDVDGDRYYSKVFTLKATAYIQSQDDMIKQKSVNKILTIHEIKRPNDNLPESDGSFNKI